MAYVEEREFSLRFELRCEFSDDYEGDADGYVWAREFQGIASELVRAAMTVLAKHPGWRARTGNRGRPTEDEVVFILERVLGSPGN